MTLIDSTNTPDRVPTSAISLADPLTKPLVFRYSIFHQLLVYSLIGFTALTAWVGLQQGEAPFVCGAFLVLLLIPLWFASAVAEVDGSGITLRRLYGVHRRTIEWAEIRTIRPAVMGVGMKLTTSEGAAVSISSQLHGYPSLVEILRSRRPDLFDTAGGRIFQKGFLGKYGMFIGLMIATPIALGSIFAPPFLPGLFFVGLLVYFWIAAFHNVYLIKLQKDTIFTQSFRRSREITARQISSMGMITVRSRRGVAKHYVQLELVDGGVLRFTGFPEGNEMMLGVLKNWWSAQVRS